MKTLQTLSVLVCFLASIHMSVFGQENSNLNEYKPAINSAIEYITLFKNEDKAAIKASFVETGFQTKKEFGKIISSQNIKWASGIINQFGIPKENEIGISVWKVGNKQSDSQETSINVSFYFKEAEAKHDPTNDRISINLTMVDGVYKIDGLLLFKKSDYDSMKSIIKDMP